MFALQNGQKRAVKIQNNNKKSIMETLELKGLSNNEIIVIDMVTRNKEYVEFVKEHGLQVAAKMCIEVAGICDRVKELKPAFAELNGYKITFYFHSHKFICFNRTDLELISRKGNILSVESDCNDRFVVSIVCYCSDYKE